MQFSDRPKELTDGTQVREQDPVASKHIKLSRQQGDEFRASCWASDAKNKQESAMHWLCTSDRRAAVWTWTQRCWFPGLLVLKETGGEADMHQRGRGDNPPGFDALRRCAVLTPAGHCSGARTESRAHPVQQLLEGCSGARLVISEQAARKVGEGLRHNGIVGVDSQRCALNNTESPQYQGKVWRDVNGIILGQLLQSYSDLQQQKH